MVTNETAEVEFAREGGKLSNAEKETVIVFNETNEPAEIFTYNKKLQRKLDLLCETREEAECYKSESVAGALNKSYRVPKKWIKVTATRILTDEQKQKLAERGKALYEKSKKAVTPGTT